MPVALPLPLPLSASILHLCGHEGEERGDAHKHGHPYTVFVASPKIRVERRGITTLLAETLAAEWRVVSWDLMGLRRLGGFILAGSYEKATPPVLCESRPPKFMVVETGTWNAAADKKVS